MDPKIEELASVLKDLIVGRAKKYLNAQIAARKEFLEERAKRLAELTVFMAKATTDADRDGVKLQMETVSDTIENELVAAAVDASVEARAAFGDAVSAVVDYALKALPWIMKAAAL
jgi:hypothetical protein